MSVANSGVFKVVDAIQVELAELAASIPAAVSLDAINASIATLNTEVDAINASITTLNTEVTTLNTEVTTLNTEVTTLNTGVAALNDATKILYNWQFKGGNANGGWIVPGGPLPAGVYAATGYVTISDTAFTNLRLLINGPGEITFSDYAQITFVQTTHSIDEYTMPVSFYFKVDQDLPSIFLDIASNLSGQGLITASVQIYKVNQAWPTPLAPPA